MVFVKHLETDWQQKQHSYILQILHWTNIYNTALYFISNRKRSKRNDMEHQKKNNRIHQMEILFSY
jgi:hypothetical protein